jgi:hypothetical protein
VFEAIFLLGSRSKRSSGSGENSALSRWPVVLFPD